MDNFFMSMVSGEAPFDRAPTIERRGFVPWLSINDRELLSGLAKELNLPVILVVGLRLGCLNAAILSAEAILRDGLKLAGWVGNHLSENWSHGDDNIATLHSLLPAPCLGIVPWRPLETAAERGQYLNLSALALPARV